jgi:hypothetical protein
MMNREGEALRIGSDGLNTMNSIEVFRRGVLDDKYGLK